MHSNLVIVRAGRHSKHLEWLQGANPEFDLIILNYEEIDSNLLRVAKLAKHIPGSKVLGWSIFFSQHRDVFASYERIALIDDDLSCSADDINRAFTLGQKHGLKIWQPSLTSDSHFTYSTFQNNFLFEWRYVNFIEMMCPFMTSATLERLLPLFTIGYETGIDRFWCRLIEKPYKACAVLDAVKFRHTRSVGQNREMQGFVGAKHDYQIVINEMETLSGISYKGTVAYAGVTRTGLLIKSRMLMAALSMVPLIWRLKNPTKKYFKRFFISFKHNLLSDVDFESVSIDSLIARFSR